MPVFQLDENEIWFPNPYLGEEDGLIAIGGDLSPERLFLAYSHGFFPWFSFRDNPEPVWYCPLERFVIFPGEIHISHSLRTQLNKDRYIFTINKAFEHVIRACALADGRIDKEGAWLGPDIIEAYTQMYMLGLAKSVEVWQRTSTEPHAPLTLAGGLYGIQMKNAFFGESMFSNVPGGSKMALVHLARTALKKGWRFIDCQFETPHLKSMGGRHIPYDEYMEILGLNRNY